MKFKGNLMPNSFNQLVGSHKWIPVACDLMCTQYVPKHMNLMSQSIIILWEVHMSSIKPEKIQFSEKG